MGHPPQTDIPAKEAARRDGNIASSKWLICENGHSEIYVAIADDLRPLPLSMRKALVSRLLGRRTDGILARSALFRAACNMGLKGLVSKRRETAVIGAPGRRTGQGEEPQACSNGA
jgi:hypothetical protein